jgi:hypothetical protein
MSKQGDPENVHKEKVESPVWGDWRLNRKGLVLVYQPNDY